MSVKASQVACEERGCRDAADASREGKKEQTGSTSARRGRNKASTDSEGATDTGIDEKETKMDCREFLAVQSGQSVKGEIWVLRGKISLKGSCQSYLSSFSALYYGTTLALALEHTLSLQCALLQCAAVLLPR